MLNGVSSGVVRVMSLACGGSLTAVTVMVKTWAELVSTPPLAVPPSSWRVAHTLVLPLASAAGVKVSTPAALNPGWPENRGLSSLVRVKASDCPVSSTAVTGPGRMVVAQPGMTCGPASSNTVWSGPAANSGGSLTGVMVTVSVAVSVNTPSLMV